jgi:aminoglycoside phosphotransferase (APT) family kinase protein
VKLAEGGFNRTFLITMHDGFEMVARIPYPITVPKFYAIASEVATMRFLRSSGLPVPEVYDYSPSSDNTAKTEYIFMEFMRGTKLSDVLLELEEPDIVSVLRQLVQLESRMMSIPFPAGGSLYYTNDLEKVAGRTGIPLNDERFCVGLDARLHMWYGRRSQLDVDRGPCTPLSAFFFC